MTSTNPNYAFIGRQLAMLGDRDPLEVLGETADRLDALVRAHSAETLSHRSGTGWTPNEVLAHLADMEWVFGFRARTILCDDQPELAGIGQNEWVIRQHANDVLPSVHAENFRALRTVTLTFWRRVPVSQLERFGRHHEAGVPYTLGFVRQLQAGHDLVHLDQIGRLLSRR